MMQKTACALAAAAALTAPAAQAAQPSYDLVEVLWAETVPDTGGTARGYALNGSYDFGHGFFGEGLYYHLNDSSVPGGVTSENFFLGPGYRVHTEIVDVFLSVDYLHRSVDGPASSASQDGYRWVWGLRSAVTDRLELNTGVEKSSVGLTDTGLRLGESYRFTDKLALPCGPSTSGSRMPIAGWSG